MLAFRAPANDCEWAFNGHNRSSDYAFGRCLAVHYKERLRTFVPGRPGSPRSLVDQSLGLARLELPDGWRQAEDLNDNASIEAINSLHGRHVIVISDAIEDFVPEMTVYEIRSTRARS